MVYLDLDDSVRLITSSSPSDACKCLSPTVSWLFSRHWHRQGQNDVTAEDLALREDICHQIFGDAVGALVRGTCYVLDARSENMRATGSSLFHLFHGSF